MLRSHLRSTGVALVFLGLAGLSSPVSGRERSARARAGQPVEAPGQPGAGWPGEKLPLPIVVETPSDLAIKSLAERYYLVFNLLASGKLAWERKDWPEAARRWEELLALPDLPRDVARTLRPLAIEARRRADGSPPSTVLLQPERDANDSEETAGVEAGPVAVTPRPLGAADPLPVSVSGLVSGGGALGPAGAVLWLKRRDGRTPRPRPLRGRTMDQVGKDFVPHILPVTVGTQVSFRNRDPLHHNVFSLSKPNDFDSGLYAEGGAYERRFDAPGAVQILCNIHASMLAYVVVLDTPWYALARPGGSFTIRGVPPGEYDLYAWHESSSTPTRLPLTVGPDGVRGVSIGVGGDRPAPRFVPDKYGKPRQSQLGY